MSINIGNSKIGKIYVGSTAIGKVYKGSELMWESGPSLKLYGTTFNYAGNQINGYLIGSWSTSGVLMPSRGTLSITSISGTLGASGSKISGKYSSSDLGFVDAVYNKTFTVNGIKVYLYYKYASLLDDYALVMEKSKVGSIALDAFINLVTNPTSVTTTTAVGGGITYTKDSSGDATWYLTGVK